MLAKIVISWLNEVIYLKINEKDTFHCFAIYQRGKTSLKFSQISPMIDHFQEFSPKLSRSLRYRVLKRVIYGNVVTISNTEF